MDFIWNSITDWLKEVLVSGIVSNLSGMSDLEKSPVRLALPRRRGIAASST